MMCIYIYIYIYIYCHPQTDRFVVSQLFSVARQVGYLKLGSKPSQLYVRLSIRPLGQQAYHIYMKKPSLLYYLPIAGGKIIGFIPFPRVFVLCEMLSVSSRILTRFAVSISYDDNHYTTGTSLPYKSLKNWLQHSIILHESTNYKSNHSKEKIILWEKKLKN